MAPPDPLSKFFWTLADVRPVKNYVPPLGVSETTDMSTPPVMVRVESKVLPLPTDNHVLMFRVPP